MEKSTDVSDTYVNEEGRLFNGPFRVLRLVEFRGFIGFITASAHVNE